MRYRSALKSRAGGRAANATERILMMAEIIKQRPTGEWLHRSGCAGRQAA
jgi:hypothetical protein